MILLLYFAIFLFGAAIGSQLNRGIYRLAWDPRQIGPWSAPHADAARRRMSDYIPILGWIGLRREAPIHGAGFWIRPLLIELAMGSGLVALYWWEVTEARLMPVAIASPFDLWMLHWQFLTHALLICLMTVATFIDFDEKTIPDAITVPGTLLGLVLMACFPIAGLPIAVPDGDGGVTVSNLLLTSPHAWVEWLDGPKGLLAGIGCFVGWGLAIWPKTVTCRRGIVKAIQYLVVSMFRYPFWWLILIVLAVGSGLISLVWFWGGAHWQSLLTALVGMAFGGGLIWAIRIVGGSALGKEAMGFGDVTLMAMIGVYVGWQSSLLIFFMAPFVAVAICLVQWIATQRRDIAFGPYLCVSALLLIIYWENMWQQRARPVFYLGWLVPQILFFCLILMAGMLWFWRLIERMMFGTDPGSTVEK